MLKYSGLYQEECADLMVVCQIYDQNQPIALPVSTSYKSFTSRWKYVGLTHQMQSYFKNIFVLSWNEWVTLPVQFSDLPRTAQLALTVYDYVGPSKMAPVGGTTISLFSKYGVFKQVGA